MTDKPNALQVVSRDLLERLHGWLTHIHHFRVADMADLETALRQAPALGSEPKAYRYRVVQMLSEGGNRIGYDPHGPWVVMEEAHCASVAAHQDEIKRLRSDLSKYMARADDFASKMLGAQGERDRLNARVAELESAMRQVLNHCVSLAYHSKIHAVAKAALRPTEGAQS